MSNVNKRTGLEAFLYEIKSNIYNNPELLNNELPNYIYEKLESFDFEKSDDYSYDMKLCENIAELAKILYEKNRIGDLTIDHFNIFIKEKNINRKENDLKEAIRETCKKYPIEHTVNALARFRYDGNASSFTRDKGCRYKLFGITYDELEEILSRANIKSDNYLYDYVNSVVKDNKIKFLIDAYNMTLLKHGVAQADRAIYMLFNSGDYDYFTNDNNARRNLKDNLTIEELRNEVIKYLDLDEYITNTELADAFIDSLSKEKESTMKYS